LEEGSRTKGAQSLGARPIGSRDNTAIVAVALIMTYIVIAAGFMVVLDGRDASTNVADTSRGIKEGSCADYKATITNGSWFTFGTCRIAYSNVTDSSYVMTMILAADGKTVTNTTTVTYVGNMWDTQGSYDDGTTVSVIGNETVQTDLGTKNATHTRTVSPDHAEDDWYHGSGCILKAEVVYSDGSTLQLVLAGTNIECLWD
jgi:hypothetical protein